MTLDSHKIDLVTVCYLEEMRMLKMQARSIRLHADGHFINKIFVIFNDRNFPDFQDKFRAEIEHEYGEFANRLVLVDGWSNLKKSRGKGGWVRQQVLKWQAARFIESSHFMILDSKNHFIKRFSAEHAFAQDGRMLISRYPLNKAFTRKFLNACALFGAHPTDADFDQAMPQSTPYIASKQLVEEMMDEMEGLLGVDFETAFVKKGPFTEFYLYYAYILSKEGLFDRWYYQARQINVTFWNHAVETPDSFGLKMKRLNKPNVCSMGVHRRYIKNAPQEFMGGIKALWHDAGLVRTDEEFDYFSALPQTRASIFRRIFSGGL